jgi:hypothetical protein
MPEMHVNPGDAEGFTEEPDSTEPEPSQEPPASRRGRRTPAIAAGLAALMLAGPVAAGAGAGGVETTSSGAVRASCPAELRDQFADAFTPGPAELHAGPPGSIKICMG